MFFSLGFGLLCSFQANNAKFNVISYVKREIEQQHNRHIKTQIESDRERYIEKNHMRHTNMQIVTITVNVSTCFHSASMLLFRKNPKPTKLHSSHFSLTLIDLFMKTALH